MGDNDLENQQLYDNNALEYNNNENNSKKTIATQVDYVSLIMARNFEDWKFNDADDQNKLINNKQLEPIESASIVRKTPNSQSLSNIIFSYSFNKTSYLYHII